LKRTASQVGKMSRRKGKAFERWCARYFTKWTGLKWETTRNSGRTDLKGDIYCVSRPDLPLVVECKNDKRYSVHAMMKPTKAFTDMVYDSICRAESVDSCLIIIVKNETGVWMYSKYMMFKRRVTASKLFSVTGCWTKIQDITFGEIKGVKFGVYGMVESG